MAANVFRLPESAQNLPGLRWASEPVGETSRLTPSERRIAQRFGPLRLATFAAGRRAARKALRQPGTTIERGEHGQPIWPAGAAGSITHTNEIALAVCWPSGSTSHSARSVGVDLENIAAVSPESRQQICSQTELSAVASDLKLDTVVALALIFSAKEAAYKAVFPLFEEFVGYRQARIKVKEAERFEIRFDRSLRTAAANPQLAGYYWVDGKHVLTLALLRIDTSLGPEIYGQT